VSPRADPGAQSLQPFTDLGGGVASRRSISISKRGTASPATLVARAMRSLTGPEVATPADSAVI